MITGKIKFTSDKLDVTDPCYDKDVWCRMTVDIVPGTYDYEVITYDGRCRYISIKLEGASSIRRGLVIGEIGVDAGLAGFFENKPDYDDDEWMNVCRNIHGNYGVVATDKDDKAPFGCECVFCYSGYGDGLYEVRPLLDYRDVIVGYEIKFF